MSATMRGVQYGVLTEEQIKAMAAVEVTEFTLHSRGVPKANSPADTRFGTCSRFQRCGTCKNTMLECPGHPGYIQLPHPMPHVGFLPYTIKVLNLVCFNCSAFLLPDLVFPDRVKAPDRKLAYAYEEARRARARKRCSLACPNPDCGLPQPIIRSEEPFFVLDWYDDVVEEHFKAANPDAPPKKVVAKKKKKGKKRKNDEEPVETAKKLKDDDGEGIVPSPPTTEEIQAMEQRKADLEYFVKRPFTNWDVYNVLRSIKKSDLPKMGMNPEFSNPAGFMLTCLLVPAIGVRPTMSFEEGSKRSGYHQLTRTLSEIVKLKKSLLNEAAKHRIRLDDQDAPHVLPEAVSQALKLLYFNVSHYLVKNKCKVHKLKLSPYAARAHTRKKGLNQALGGKEGRYRAQLLGRRVDFCMRTVVTPNPDSDIDEIGIPRALARRLTVPVRVTTQNKPLLQQMMADGEIQQIVDEYTGDMIAVGDHNKDTLPLMTGWVVERFLRDGDTIPINRQPTLHRPSIMGHRVKLHDDLTLMLNPATMTAYNADCDGDEMNGHVPQTPEARAEVAELMPVANHMINPRANKPIIAPIQDYLDAAWYLTKQTVLLTKAQASQLLMLIKYDPNADPKIRLGRPGAEIAFPKLPPPAIAYPEERWTGKQIVSCTLPDISLKRKLKNRPRQLSDDKLMEADGVVEIVHGQLLRGTLCKQTLGGSAGGIIHVIATYRSNHTASRFISDIQRVLNHYLMGEGFSVGLRDCLSTDAVKGKTQLVIEAAERHIAEIRKIAAELPNDPEVQDLAEDQLRNTLKSMAFMVGNVVKAHLTDDNRFNVMASTVGSKGSVFNMGQVMAAVLQTFVNGERPDSAGSNRVLPSAPLPGQAPLTLKEELDIRGFIRTPYKAGLTPAEAYMHNTGGREGLVDTAAKVARTGYLQRRLVKTTEGHHVAHDGTIRDAYQSMYQPHFGTDGMDPMRTLKVELRSLLLDDAELKARCIAPMPGGDHRCHEAGVAEWTRLKECRDDMRKARQTTFLMDLRKSTEVYIPFDVNVLVSEQQRRCNCGKLEEPTPADLAQSFFAVDKLCRLINEDVPALFLEYHLRTDLATARLKKLKVCSACVIAVCRRALRMHKDARLQPGEGIGVVTATSVGEPMSQLTLNSVSYDTTFVFKKDGVCKGVIVIGDFIDAEVDKAIAEGRPNVQHYPNGQIWVPLTENWSVRSADEHGHIAWDRIEAVTRHPVINADGSTDLLEITTEKQRVAQVTMGESMLQYKDVKLVPVRADSLKVGDLVPVNRLYAKDNPHVLGDVALERIVGIERIPYGRPWVYDLTVERTRNMELANGLIVRDSFHQAGAAKSNMTYGIPRMKELIGATRNTLTPLITLHLKEGLKNPKVAAELLARHLPYTLLRNIVKVNREVYEPDICKCGNPDDVAMVNRHLPFLEHVVDRASRWVIRIELCKQRAGSRSLEPRAVADLIQDELQSGALVIASNVEDPQWTIRVYLLDVAGVVDTAFRKSVQTGTTRAAAKRVSQRQSMLARKNRKYMDLTSASAKKTTIPVPLHRISKALKRKNHSPRDVVEWLVVRDTLSNLRDLRVCGIKAITSATVRSSTSTRVDPETGKVSPITEHVVDARGTNLAEVSLLHAVDPARVISNNVISVYETYGITAAAHTLYNELCTCLSASGTRVDERMVKLVVDVITHNGYIMPVSRHGLNKLERHGVLAKFTFEETVRTLFKAAAFGEYDPLRGVSETTIVGLEAKLGSNLSQMYVDRDGLRVPCNQTQRAGPSSASLDTRVLCSDFVGDEEDEEEVEDEAACFEETLDRILVSRTNRPGRIESVVGMGGEIASMGLYRNQLYTPIPENPTGSSSAESHESSSSPREASTPGPFRPSSPILDPIEEAVDEGELEPFKPSSPVFDD